MSKDDKDIGISGIAINILLPLYILENILKSYGNKYRKT